MFTKSSSFFIIARFDKDKDYKIEVTPSTTLGKIKQSIINVAKLRHSDDLMIVYSNKEIYDDHKTVDDYKIQSNDILVVKVWEDHLGIDHFTSTRKDDDPFIIENVNKKLDPLNIFNNNNNDNKPDWYTLKEKFGQHKKEIFQSKKNVY